MVPSSPLARRTRYLSCPRPPDGPKSLVSRTPARCWLAATASSTLLSRLLAALLLVPSLDTITPQWAPRTVDPIASVVLELPTWPPPIPACVPRLVLATVSSSVELRTFTASTTLQPVLHSSIPPFPTVPTLHTPDVTTPPDLLRSRPRSLSSSPTTP